MTDAPERTWWESLRHAGLLLGPAQVRDIEKRRVSRPLKEGTLNHLRREILLFDADAARGPEFVTWCFQHLFGFDEPAEGAWLRAQHVPAKYSHQLLSGETLKPRQIWTGVRHGVLPVFYDKAGNHKLGQHRGRKTYSDVLQWLRLARLPLAILTNARQWRIVYAGLDADAFCESDLDRWLEEGQAGLQLEALCQLIQPALWDPAQPGEPAPLAAAIAASRKGQAELSTILGERVREAVEALVRAHGEPLKAAGLAADGQDIYRAAVRVVMRMVVVLFAESRDLLPKSLPMFYDHYSLQGLFEQLQRLYVRGRGRLTLRHAAWPRVLALFRLIYEGSHHEALPIRAYGGELFAPGDTASPDPVLRALGIFETACFDSRTGAMPDLVVHGMLELLTRSRVKIRQGRGSTTTLMPVDFGDLSSEYIGILYEGLLDYELRTAPADDCIVFLGVGNEPSLPLSRLEAMDDTRIKEMIKELGAKQKADEDGDEEDLGDAEKESGEGEGQEDGIDEVDVDDDEVVDHISVADATRARALAWTQRACLAAGFVKKPKGKATPEKQMQFDRSVQAAARQLLRRLVLPGEWFLVRWGGTRKGAGTFYTRPQLAIPLVQRTLQPLAYDAADDIWTPKKPEDILALKVADIAGGSGSFPVAALRYLTDALYKSLWAHGRITEDAARKPLHEVLGLALSSENLTTERLPVPPSADDFEPRTRAILRRHVVERCIYAVDIDPLAVELCRMALWIETMDRDLPFSFLDHKVKCGNSLVGCWFDHYRHYPVLAWKREGGDKAHTNGVHNAKEARTRALKEFLNDRVKPDLVNAITGQGTLFAGCDTRDVAALHDEALAELQAIHDLPVHETAERARRFKALEQRPDWQNLKAAFDRWCACWFWPADQLDHAPLATTFGNPPETTANLAADIARQKRFFHWELEFPDVFACSSASVRRNPEDAAHGAATTPGGFDAIIGNPPWEIAKPNSKEFFSNLDPLYRSYGKQDALRRQTELFAHPEIEKRWLDYSAGFKEQSNFVGCAAFPFGDPEHEAEGGDTFSLARGNQSKLLHDRWRARRKDDLGYADPGHPFRHQGSADLNLYKLFLENAHALLKQDGRLGYLVPSGIYSDHGSGGLRTLFLDHCRWEWLFGFENRDGIFSIHRSFKFNPVIIQKGGKTEAIRTAFMRRDVDDWANAEKFATPYTRERVTRFSPRSKAILEIQSARDLEILEKIYANSVLLGDDGPDGWGIKYATEFHMTNDSKLFPPRPKWEEQGYQPDEYSRWLKGNWQPVSNLWKKLGIELPPPGTRRCAQPPYDTLPIPRADLPEGLILNRDATQYIAEKEIEAIALPLYEGRMIGQFDFSQKGWVSGKGRTAVWRDIPWDQKQIESQYLMGIDEFQSAQLDRYLSACKKSGGPEYAEQEQRRLTDEYELKRWWNAQRLKTSLIDVTAATNTRTTFTTLLIETPCGNSAPILRGPLSLSFPLNSLAFDTVARFRCTGLHLNWFVIEEAVLPKRTGYLRTAINSLTLSMTGVANRYAELWMNHDNEMDLRSWRSAWAVTEHERLRIRVISDCVAAAAYGLSTDELHFILLDCDHSLSTISSTGPGLNSKGFWRVDKDKDPELRHTVLTLAAFHDLQKKIEENGGDREKGIEAFLNQNDGEGWMLPETLRLADYGLGRDDRAKQPQPVASRLGPRFYDWQLAQSLEESWKECHLHARNLLGEDGYKALRAEINGEPKRTLEAHEPSPKFQIRNDPTQGELF